MTPRQIELIAEYRRRSSLSHHPKEPTMDTVTEAPAVPADRHDVGYPKPPAVDLMPPAEPHPWEAIPDGQFAIVELFGHATLVGRIAEVEQFGSKMLAIQPLFNGAELPVVLHGGASIYRLTRCTREVAWEQQPKVAWNLPASIQALIPPAALPAPYSTYGAHDDEGER